MKIDGKTKITGIFGYPIEHTLSPFIHNAGYEYLGLNYIYIPFSVHPEDLGKATDSLKALNISGINVTVPHKEKILRYLDDIDSYAEKIGAVNTVINKNGKLVGYNTDAIGFLKSLKENINPHGKKVVLLGCGGAGKAIAVSLVLNGIEELFIYDVDFGKAEKFSKKLMPFTKKISVIKSDNSLKNAVWSADILINATTVGMKPLDKTPVPANWLNKRTFVYDIIYNRKTELIKIAEKIGCKYIDGLDMLLYQAAKSFELWTNRKAPIEIMRKALKRALKYK
ncbi:MAG: shikimate dehydrogenase [Endomicrobiia bacterium]